MKPKYLPDEEILKVVQEVIGIDVSKSDPVAVRNLLKSIRVGLSIATKLRKMDDEIKNLLDAMEGKYVEPGSSGSLLRGKVEILPTGRNFYSFDPQRVPTEAAWEIGRRLAEKLISKYKQEYGVYPETIAFILWCIDPFRADAEEVAQILYTLGVKPVWDPESGCVVDIEPIPLDELGRPRIDVLVRVDGIFRDTTPNLIALIDRAVRRVAALNESPRKNYVRKHVLERLRQLGKTTEESFRIATYRVFSEKPGAYGAGVEFAVYASAWKSKGDLAETWIEWSAYAYGENERAVFRPEELKNILRSVDLTYQKLEADDFDVLDCCCFFAYHGGLHVAAETIKQRRLPAYFGDTRNPDNPKVRRMEEEIERVVLTRLLNPNYIEGLRKHGFRGAAEISERVDRLYGWAATAGVVKDWIFTKISESFILNKEMKEWFMKTNPYALEEMTRRLLEAAERGIWRAPKEVLRALTLIHNELEGVFEGEIISSGEYQGGEVVIITRDELKRTRK